jgi:hypothetical protein
VEGDRRRQRKKRRRELCSIFQLSYNLLISLTAGYFLEAEEEGKKRRRRGRDNQRKSPRVEERQNL